MKKYYLLSVIDDNQVDFNPYAIFDSIKELIKGVERAKDSENCSLYEDEDYTIKSFTLNKFYN